MVREKRMVQKLKGQAYERDGPIVEIKLRPSKGKKMHYAVLSPSGVN